MIKGQCLCGNIHFSSAKPVTKAIACHCGQCRRQTSHQFASAEVEDADLTITGDVTWFTLSPEAKRGFCATCGSFLFWKGLADSFTCVSMGALESPTGLRLSKHIFTADKGDYYDIADGVPQS